MVGVAIKSRGKKIAGTTKKEKSKVKVPVGTGTVHTVGYSAAHEHVCIYLNMPVHMFLLYTLQCHGHIYHIVLCTTELNCCC
jgi:hypothetical protein